MGTMTNLQENLARKIEARRLPVSKLERMAGLKPNAVRNILSGASRNPSASTLLAIVKHLNCTVEELIQETKPRGASEESANFDLLTRCCELINQTCQCLGVHLPLSGAMTILSETYTYAQKKGASPDVPFIEWLLERSISRDRSD